MDHVLHLRPQFVVALFVSASIPGYSFIYPLIQNRRFQVLLSSIIQTYSAGRFRETPELERLFIRMFDELSATDEYSLTGPDEETLRLISALHAQSLPA